MTQSAGLLVPDTKMDLALDPAGFLGRALHLWDAQAAFGQLQNQAYGYLWPMGPFFVLGSLFDLPGWVVQRLWMALVLCVALVGSAKVTRALGVRSDLACLVAGFAFALSPRMLTVVGPSSIEVWPSALAPWVLLPLVLGAEKGSPRLASARSAVAVAMVGGVNAVATFAVIPLGVLWILTRQAGPRRRALMVWWPAFVLLGTLWWLIPLFTLGAYSPPFLDFIESASVTTYPTNLFDALRGTSNWVAYVDPQSFAGGQLLSQYHYILNSATLMVCGLAGLTLRRNPHRRFLVLGVLTGLFAVTMGHLGSGQGLFAQPLNSLLDGALAPLRNVHKFDPIIRLPLVVGLAWALEEGLSRLRTRRTAGGRVADGVAARTLIVSIVAATMVMSVPFAVGNVAAKSGFTGVPDYWQQAADWLGEHDEQGVALLVPGSAFGTYVWGQPHDEPMQAIAESPWAVRNAVPLAPAGNIRMLNEIEQRLTEGHGGRAFTAYLARAGVTHLLVRNDLVRSGVTDPVLVHQTIDQSPGLRLVSEFGPEVGGDPEVAGDLGRALINGGWQNAYSTLEIYEVADAVNFATSTDSPTTVVGGPEDLLDLADLGLIGAAPAVLAIDAPDGRQPDGPLVLTDGLRRVERHFARSYDAVSQTLVPGDPYSVDRQLRDYQLPGQASWDVEAEYVGADAVRATSSGSEPGGFGGGGPGEMPYAAIDGDPDSAWVSSRSSGVPQSWWVDIGAPVSARRIAVTVGLGTGNEQLRVRTEDWESPVLDFQAGERRVIEGPGTAERLWVEDVSGTPGNQISIAEVEVDDLTVERRLVLPDLPATWGDPDAIALRRVADARTGCATVDSSVRCRALLQRTEEEAEAFARRFSLAEPRAMDLSMRVETRAGEALNQLLQSDQIVSVRSSTTAMDDPRASAVAMIDGDFGTTWIAQPGDISPTISFRFLKPVNVRGLALGVERGTAARRPQSFELSWPGGERRVEVGDDGTLRFPAISTKSFDLKVIDAEPATDLDFGGSASDVPVGISELRLVGAPFLPVALSELRRKLPCGAGPDVTVNDEVYRTTVTASPAGLASGSEAEATVCGAKDVQLRSGVNEVEVGVSDAFRANSVVLGDASAQVASALGTRLGQASRMFEGTEESYVVTRENVNAGWDAGGNATPQVFDGWRQGWLVDDASPLTVRFGPERLFRAGLVLGAGAWVLLFASALLRRRARASPAPVGEGAGRAWVATAALVVFGAVLAGWIGGALALVTVGVVAVAHRRTTTVEGWWLAALLVPAAVPFLFNPWTHTPWAGGFSWPPYVVLAACSAVAAWVFLDTANRRPSRMPGRSTTQ
ncbi:MAG: alpha-(1-_3)-arabinofuranosyltransferase [Nocardioides sp.]|uniref:alpha-(1->3)-arabinofuranosyltransferase n=1 Tax=Nocardioides sp. TaxID=35761 RepID=UPI003267B8A2